MRAIIRQQADLLGYGVDGSDVEEIINRYFNLLHKNGEIWVTGVRSAIRAYFSTN